MFNWTNTLAMPQGTYFYRVIVNDKVAETKRLMIRQVQTKNQFS